MSENENTLKIKNALLHKTKILEDEIKKLQEGKEESSPIQEKPLIPEENSENQEVEKEEETQESKISETPQGNFIPFHPPFYQNL